MNKSLSPEQKAALQAQLLEDQQIQEAQRLAEKVQLKQQEEDQYLEKNLKKMGSLESEGIAFVKLGPEATIFFDPSTRIKILKNQIISASKIPRSTHIERSLKSGHLIACNATGKPFMTNP